MARIARAVVGGVAHHLYQRGGRAKRVFFSDKDRRRYLEIITAYARRNKVEVLAYCLMRDHVHFVVVPRTAEGLAKTFRAAHLSYSQYMRRTHGLPWRMFAGRFLSCPLDDQYCRAAIRFVETNPVRAHLVKRAEQYPWSSAPRHAGLCRDPLVATRPGRNGIIPDWSRKLRAELPETTVALLRRHVGTGRPLGSEEFVRRVERRTGREFHRKKPGPKPGQKRRATRARRRKSTTRRTKRSSRR